MNLNLLTGEQIRAARALTRVDQAGLARRCGLSLETIRRLERTHGPVDANVRTLGDIAEAFRELGVVFDGPDGGGLSLRLRQVQGAEVPQPPAERMFPRGAGMPTLHRLIYCSTLILPDGDALELALHRIRSASGFRNAACGVVGALVVSDGRALGVLEGPRSAVFDLYGLIAMDRNHRDLVVIESSDVPRSRRSDPPMICARLDVDELRRLRVGGNDTGYRPERLSGPEAMKIIDLVRAAPMANPKAMWAGDALPAERRRRLG